VLALRPFLNLQAPLCSGGLCKQFFILLCFQSSKASIAIKFNSTCKDFSVALNTDLQLQPLVRCCCNRCDLFIPSTIEAVQPLLPSPNIVQQFNLAACGCTLLSQCTKMSANTNEAAVEPSTKLKRSVSSVSSGSRMRGTHGSCTQCSFGHCMFPTTRNRLPVIHICNGDIKSMHRTPTHQNTVDTV